LIEKNLLDYSIILKLNSSQIPFCQNNCYLPSSIGNITTLTKLVISYEKPSLLGMIPTEIGNLVNLNYIDVSNNLLYGPIPDQLWSLTNLTFIDFSNNNLNSTISTYIGNDSMLSNLDLSFNQLCGIIPSQIKNLNVLLTTSSCFLNNNHLTNPFNVTNCYIINQTSCGPGGLKDWEVFVIIVVAAFIFIVLVVIVPLASFFDCKKRTNYEAVN